MGRQGEGTGGAQTDGGGLRIGANRTVRRRRRRGEPRRPRRCGWVRRWRRESARSRSRCRRTRRRAPPAPSGRPRPVPRRPRAEACMWSSSDSSSLVRGAAHGAARKSRAREELTTLGGAVATGPRWLGSLRRQETEPVRTGTQCGLPTRTVTVHKNPQLPVNHTGEVGRCSTE
ncbi:hypothetical protein P354_00965 [Streptomyces noursei PD-1]|nr:hypothetical protein P354_00965 [Streptomyces noursei PD-1]